MNKRSYLVPTFVLAIALAGCSGGSTASSPSGSSSSGGSASPSPTRTLTVPDGFPTKEPKVPYNKWEWFKDTYWYVPENGIYSVYHHDTSDFQVSLGQTVFHLTDYFNGYFTGSVVVKWTRALQTNCQYVLGQVTPSGRVYLTMYDASSGAVTNNPVGSMEKVDGQWTMVNTMTGPGAGTNGTVSHWAYMVQTKPGQHAFNKLPFADESIPDFMDECPAGPMLQRGV